jgi:diguanylate cyclase (GGDEF)-like protein/PAS domain S-box-containing protein
VAAVEQGSAPGRAAMAYARIAVTLVFTLALVGGEFAMLSGVYHRADPVRQQRLIQAQLAGLVTELNDLATTTPGVFSPAARQQATMRIDTALQAFKDAGLDISALRPLLTARQGLSARPQEAAPLRLMAVAVDNLGLDLANRQHNLDLQAGLLYGGLLVTVSFGWFLWFRRLVARHRSLQQAVTEKQALASSEQRLLALVQNGSDVVTVLNLDSTASFVSPSAKSVLGFAAEDLVGTRIVDLIHPDDVRLMVQLLANQRAGGDQDVTLRMRHADGRTLVVEGILTNLLADTTVGGFVLTVRDVTERHALEERLTYQAFHDSLTGLANRQLFGDRLAHALQRRPGVAQPLVVLFCDLDDFKNVNDSLGHRVGDQVLEVVGQRIRSAIRVGDTAARLGGDEFAILMEATDMAEAELLAHRLVELIAEPVVIDGSVLPVTASVGMAQAVPGEISTEEALRNADVAMYSAKDRGKSTVAAYDSGLHAQALDRLELRADLQRALRDGELVLHYQPTVELDSGKITGFEALVRWQHPTRGLLAPAFFIPMAEETGMIVQLGTWVLYEACRTAAMLQSDWRRPTMAVNISSQQLARSDFVDQVTDALAAAGLHANRLTLEITESVVVRDLDTVTPRLAALRACGVRVAIDDFGTGYSSLAYLTKLPVDVLKVDKSFIDRVASDEQGASLTKAIIAMSHTMNLTTVAEGVEVAEQAAWLRQVNCPVGQGYYWSRPVDLRGVHELLSRPTNDAGGELGSVTYLTVTPSSPTGY